MIERAKLATFVAEYLRGDASGICEGLNCEAEWAEFSGLGLSQAIHHAISKESPRGKSYGHQRRIPTGLFDIARQQAMTRRRAFGAAASFDEIHSLVEKIASTIKGLGPLFAYDAATRIGASLGQWPSKVYLHAGTLEGAKKLLGRPLGKTLSVEELPSPLRQLSPAHLENFLCLYKGRF